MEELKPESFFKDAEKYKLFAGLGLVWEALEGLKEYIRTSMKPNTAGLRGNGGFVRATSALWQGEAFSQDLEIKPGDTTKGTLEVYYKGRRLEGAALVYAGAVLMDDEIELGAGAVVEPGALIKGPTIVGPKTEVRQGAYIRGSCLIGRACVVGHTTEMKNSMMLDEAKAGHFAYLGDSILGRDVNLGAGTKLANLKFAGRPVGIQVGGQVVDTARRKLGAIIGDGVETGCNSVTSPGALLGPGCRVTPNTTVPAGYYPPGKLIKSVPGPEIV